MARIAYVDHSYHQRTRSTAFLVELLTRHGHQVETFWDEAWRGGAPVEWEQVGGHDVVLMFQSYCPPRGRYFRHLHPNVIYIPMLDQFGLWQGAKFNLGGFWEPFQGSKVLNFSRAAHGLTLASGIASYCVRFYQPVLPRPDPPSLGLHGFFWLRRPTQLPWATIRALIGTTPFDSLHLHLATDPGTPPPELPTAQEIVQLHITTSMWFDHRSELDTVMARANVYFAPRLEEGIGQSFAEALARGQCVVAPDQGTMNEYILPGVNGLLYDHRHPAPLDFSQVSALGARARQAAVAGRLAWEAGEQALVDFILCPSRTLYEGGYQHPGLLPLAKPRPFSWSRKLIRAVRGLWRGTPG